MGLWAHRQLSRLKVNGSLWIIMAFECNVDRRGNLHLSLNERANGCASRWSSGRPMESLAQAQPEPWAAEMLVSLAAV